MTLCPRCDEQQYDETVDDVDPGVCMACQAKSSLAELAPTTQLPPHRVTDQGVGPNGQPYARLRFADRSELVIDLAVFNELGETEAELVPLRAREMSPESVRETVVHLDSQPITEEMVQWLDKLATELGFRLDLDALRRNTMLGGAILFADLAQGQATMWAQ